jgi:hypothetical protein
MPARADRTFGAGFGERAAALSGHDQPLVTQDPQGLLDSLAGDPYSAAVSVPDGSCSSGPKDRLTNPPITSSNSPRSRH